MAFYIEIEKNTENDVVATYRYWSVENDCGEFEINKQSGEVKLLIQANGDRQGHLFNRAALKVMRGWKQGKLPDKTVWAS
ncbi:hypothetical protein [Caballeronia sp. HLA56]